MGMNGDQTTTHSTCGPNTIALSIVAPSPEKWLARYINIDGTFELFHYGD
ncbi:hypothetical protein CRE_18252 [Caenorhabditis remanei]|uniref:Uncharacterized protein n=1 Tax=Caenorhabditis remanei TaxID=31234 RepID=E3NFI4_CAERE|nr:hypothetical protein CRE_18252 [Caenorhabditis remanei]